MVIGLAHQLTPDLLVHGLHFQRYLAFVDLGWDWRLNHLVRSRRVDGVLLVLRRLQLSAWRVLIIIVRAILLLVLRILSRILVVELLLRHGLWLRVDRLVALLLFFVVLSEVPIVHELAVLLFFGIHAIVCVGRRLRIVLRWH